MSTSRLAERLYGDLAADRSPVHVVEVGCSHGGVSPEWDIFGSALHAVGFDPLVAEIERLRGRETRPNIGYEAAYVGLSAEQNQEREQYEAALPFQAMFSPNPFARSSAYRAAALAQRDYVQEMYNSGAAVVYADRRVSIDEFAAANGASPQIIKTDTDGFDTHVLLGAETALRSSVLAVVVEAQFQGSASRYAATFANIDGLMRSCGFTLFRIEPRRYTRAALPGPFAYDLFAQTAEGQDSWADTVYLRDFLEPWYFDAFDFDPTSERVTALACIMERFGLSDCSAELLQHYAPRLPYDTEPLLDLLVPDHFGPGLSYRDYIARFEADPGRLLPSRLGR